MSLAQFGSAAAKIPPQGLMKMGDSEACLATLTRTSRTMPHMPRTSGEIPHEDRAASTWFIGVIEILCSAALLAH